MPAFPPQRSSQVSPEPRTHHRPCGQSKLGAGRRSPSVAMGGTSTALVLLVSMLVSLPGATRAFLSPGCAPPAGHYTVRRTPCSITMSRKINAPAQNLAQVGNWPAPLWRGSSV